VQEVSDLSNYSSVIVGSAIQNFEWLQPAQTFLHDNSTALSKIPVWAFSVGCPWTVPKRLQKSMDVDNEEQIVKKDIEKEVKLRQHTLFNGKFLKSHFNFGMRLFWSTMGGKYGDFRNWEEIEKWANEVGDELHQMEDTA
jgi:menaquinone-dependent protoporphyrinogen oxidase